LNFLGITARQARAAFMQHCNNLFLVFTDSAAIESASNHSSVDEPRPVSLRLAVHSRCVLHLFAKYSQKSVASEMYSVMKNLLEIL